MSPQLIHQAGVIPFRRQAVSQDIEVCLITSTSGRRWGFPKGIIEHGDSPQAAAIKEALEEAGLHGEIVGDPLGDFRYEKWGADLIVTMYLMEVSNCDDHWAESNLRERAWLSPDEAFGRIDRTDLQRLLVNAVQRLT